MSLAACNPSSLRFFSICLLRAKAARSSADMAQPILLHVAFTNATPVSFYFHPYRGTAEPPPLRTPSNTTPTPLFYFIIYFTIYLLLLLLYLIYIYTI